MALLELPKGCDYWKDKRMIDMINGTDSFTHEFDGCMYGLKSKYHNIGTPIKKPWRIISWGVSFKNLHERCDGSHVHGPCAGKETRVTQLYTEEIIKVILKGGKNQTLLNNACGIKRNLKPRRTQVSNVMTCIQMRKDQESIWHVEDDQQGLQFLRFLHRGSFRLKVKETVPELRSDLSLDPDSYWTAFFVNSAMASSSARATSDEDLKTLTGPKATVRTITILDIVRKRGVAPQLPQRFAMYDEGEGPCLDATITNWIETVKIPVIVIVSLAFAARRTAPAQITHALQLLTRAFRECVLKNELDMKVESYVRSAGER